MGRALCTRTTCAPRTCGTPQRIEEDSRVVVTDWCCCEYVATPPEASRRGLIFSDYSAPELEPERRTDRSDMWSIGVMAHALLR
ncbi:unnamed protein product, partial [Prorocentrum cordatum]